MYHTLLPYTTLYRSSLTTSLVQYRCRLSLCMDMNRPELIPGPVRPLLASIIACLPLVHASHDVRNISRAGYLLSVGRKLPSHHIERDYRSVFTKALFTGPA